LQPVPREEAIANWQKASARAKWLFMLTTFGAIGVAAAIGFVVSDVSAARKPSSSSSWWVHCRFSFPRQRCSSVIAMA
jgi:hypothetical protein